MAPVLLLLASRALADDRTSGDFSAQWRNPGDVFSILLILGGDVIARALAQLVGSRMTPVAFSFGWVAYAVSAVVIAIGDNKLMPPADTLCVVINAKSGYVRINNSWIISRVVRDFHGWKDRRVSEHLQSILDKRDEEGSTDRNKGDKLQPRRRAGLCVSVYKADNVRVGDPGYDFTYWLGIGTCFIQLGIAAVPWGIFGDWGIFLITVAGMMLSFLTGSLPQWKREKWACRDKTTKDVILTKGNGSQHAILILGEGKGLDLEDLAADQDDADVHSKSMTRFALLVLAVLWILLLVTAAGIKQNTWFLLAIGGVGIAQNIFAAGRGRDPAAYGMPLTFVEVIGSAKVMATLFEVEGKYPYAGASMVDTFFPGGKLTDDEKAKWKDLGSTAKTRMANKKAQEERPPTDLGQGKGGKEADPPLET